MSEQPLDTAPVAITATDTAPTKETPADPASTVSVKDPAPAATVDKTSTSTTEPAVAEFKLPDAYKDKPWAAKIKSQDDLLKQIDNLDALVGKKVVAPIDLEKATPEQREEYYKQIRPADKDQYVFTDDTPAEERALFSELFFENGISKSQAEKMVEKYNAAMAPIREAAFSKEGMMAEMEKSFGKDHATASGATARMISEHASTEDKEIIGELPNKFLGVLYRITANMAKAYGANETGAQVTGGTVVEAVDVKKVQAELRQQIRDLDKKYHTADEKQALINKLNDTYKAKGK